MSICLSHTSADTLLELLAHKDMPLEPVSSDMLSKFSANIDEVSVVDDVAGVLSGTLELIVGDGKDVRKNRAAVCHRWTGLLPEGSILRVPGCEGLYVSSPAFCLVQQGMQLHTVNHCMMLGRYLATKSPTRDKKGKLVLADRKPLVSEEGLSLFLRDMRGGKGSKQLKEALRWTVSGAASPQETNLQLSLTLPFAYWGFGLPRPCMNYEIELGPDAHKLYPHKTCRIDICWPEKHFGLEYLGEEHKDQLDDDWSRHYAVDMEGYQLLYVTKAQLGSAEHMDYIARCVARKIKKRIRQDSWPSLGEVQRLLDILTGKAIPKKSERRYR